MSESFGSRLRRLRVAAAFTQELLAERAGISPGGVAALERGRHRTPRLSTVRLLADALELSDSDRAALAAAAAPAAEPDQVTERRSGRTGLPARLVAPMARPMPRHGFVGREKDLARLRAAWESRVGLVLVSGEAGVGKSRLASEFGRQVQDSGATLLWGRCTSEQLGAFEPFVDVTRHVVRHLDDHRLPAALGGRGDLARLAPELADRVPGLPVPSHADAGTDRRLLFEALARLLGALGPTLLVLDDLHWADAASLALLGYLTGRSDRPDVVVLGTVRSTDLDPVRAGTLADIARHGEVERLTLDGLETSDLALLVAAVVGGAPPEGMVDTVARATEGNPFFAEELTEHLLESGVIDDPNVAGAPTRVRETLGRRVGRLSSDGQMLLRVGSVLGREFDPWLAGSIATLDEARMIAATEDALLSGLVLETSPRGLVFSHALVQATVNQQLSSLRRTHIHRQAAIELERSAGDDPAEIADIARHWAAVAVTDTSVITAAARWAVRAGDSALASAAVDEAIDRYEQASRLWSGSTADHADVLIRLGNALVSSGRGAAADGKFQAALSLAGTLGDAQLAARAAIGFANVIHFGQVDADRISTLDAALAQLGSEHLELRLTGMALLMRLLAFDRSTEATRRRAELARDILASVADPGASPELLLAVGAARDSVPVDDPEILNQVTKRIIAVARQRRDLGVQANAWYGQAWSALERADASDWRTAVSEFSRVADWLGLPFELSVSATLHAASAQIEGRYAESRNLVDEALSHATQANDPNAQFVAQAQSLLLGLDRGRAPIMLGKMRPLAGDYDNILTFQSGLALTAVMAGDEVLARQILERFAQTGFEIRWDSEWPATVAFLSHACSWLGEARHADRLYRVLAEAPVVAIRLAPLAGWWGPVDHHLGALSRLLGQLDEAADRLGRALECEQAMRAAPFEARTELELARVVALRGGRQNIADAFALRHHALDVAESLAAGGIAGEARRDLALSG